MNRAWGLAAAGTLLISLAGRAAANLQYETDRTPEGVRYVLVSGDFSLGDDLRRFSRIVEHDRPSIVLFNSPGGQPQKAMDLGRLIRQFGLATFQPHGLDCESACALAFVGGVQRYADPGSIGVHQLSFSDGAPIDTAEAVSAIQELTAETLAYFTEMGVDPALLQLALQYDSTDIRFLSGSEMAEYGVTTPSAPEGPRSALADIPASEPPVEPQQRPDGERPRSASLGPFPGAPPPLGSSAVDWSVPQAQTGRVRHPKGHAPLMVRPGVQSPVFANFDNGTALEILGMEERWYHVRAGALEGYMHPSWVFVEQYDAGGFENALHIQIRSFDNYPDAEAFVKASRIPVVAYLVNNGWYAVVLRDTLEKGRATTLADYLKKIGKIPVDSFMTYGNTYVRKVCCG